MKTAIKFSILSVLAAASLSLSFGSNFPEGSPKFFTKMDAALVEAKASGKPVIAVFSAPWCPPCQMMKKIVYPSDEVKPYHDKFVWAYIDTSEEVNTPDVYKYRVNILPHIQFVSSSGTPTEQHIGGASADELVKVLDGVLKKSAKVAKK